MQAKHEKLEFFSASDLHFFQPWMWDVLALSHLPSEQMVRERVGLWFAPRNVYCSHFNTGWLIHGMGVSVWVRETRGLELPY